MASVDRDIYPEDQYPAGQWDYQVRGGKWLKRRSNRLIISMTYRLTDSRHYMRADELLIPVVAFFSSVSFNSSTSRTLREPPMSWMPTLATLFVSCFEVAMLASSTSLLVLQPSGNTLPHTLVAIVVINDTPCLLLRVSSSTTTNASPFSLIKQRKSPI